MNKNGKTQTSFGTFNDEAPLFDRAKIIVPEVPFGKQRRNKKNNGYQRSLYKIKKNISKGRLRVW